MLRFLLVTLALISADTAQTLETHKVFRITPKSKNQLRFLKKLGDDVEGFKYWSDPRSVNRPADLMVSPDKLNEFTDLMIAKSLKYEMFIDDIEDLLKRETRNATYSHFGTLDWTSYHNLEEIYSWLDLLAGLYPRNVRIIVAGTTYEGRRIKGVMLSFNAVEKPGIFIEGGIHAREWISQATATYIINELLTSNDPGVRNLAANHDWYVFPAFNPDGYAYTHIDPNDIYHRFWRKTRSPNAYPYEGCYGADMNRNWAVEWRTIGASSDPCAESYAGRSAFSETETVTMARYITSISSKLFAYLAFHSYAQTLIFPYGHSNLHYGDYDLQYAVGRKAVEALSRRYGTRYRLGNIAEVMGYASGGSVDWVKASFNLSLVYVYELRDKNSGFALPPSQIVPNCQEVMDSLVAMFNEARRYGYPRS